MSIKNSVVLENLVKLNISNLNNFYGLANIMLNKKYINLYALSCYFLKPFKPLSFPTALSNTL